MDSQIDHVTVASQDLETLQAAFDRVGLPTAYGGVHSNDVTHMAQVGFGDGTYIELISRYDTTAHSPWWHDPIVHNAGPCGWALAVEELDVATTTLADRGIAVDGPSDYQRVPEAGPPIAWELTFLGDGDPGTFLPFLISDQTPRSRRVQPTGDLADRPITGLETVLLGVSSLDRAIERFAQAFETTVASTGRAPQLSATVATLTELPVILVEPAGDSWLTSRLDQFGPLPIGYLIGTTADPASQFEHTQQTALADRMVHWLPITAPVGHRYLGVVAVA